MIKSTTDDISSLFVSLGLKKGDIVVIHSSLFSLGRIENGIQGFYDALRHVVGPEGTIVAPSFTYSFRRHEIFDIRFSPTGNEIGIFSKFILCRRDSIRSACPMFSFVAVGPEASNLMVRNTINCFGPGTVFEQFIKKKVALVGIGIQYGNGLPEFMNVEFLENVDYRTQLNLHGQSVGLDGQIYDDSSVHFARDTKRYPNGKINRMNVGKRLENIGISSVVNFASQKHFLVRADKFTELISDSIQKDEHVMFNPNFYSPSRT